MMRYNCSSLSYRKRYQYDMMKRFCMSKRSKLQLKISQNAYVPANMNVEGLST